MSNTKNMPTTGKTLKKSRRMAEKGMGAIDMSPAALTAGLKSNIDLMMKYTTAAKDTADNPMIYVWKNGCCRIMVLELSPPMTLNFDFESLGQMASDMGAQSAADAVALIYDVHGSGQKFGAWEVLLRIREGDRLWAFTQRYSYAPIGDVVVGGDGIIWDSATDPDPAQWEGLQIPAWYPANKALTHRNWV